MELETNTDSTRKLASVQIIETVVKHPNADALELVTFKDLCWQVVTRPGEAKVGDKVVYCEIDCLLPGSAKWLPEAVKGRVADQSDKTVYRVKTIKLRKEISQGLIVPFCEDLLKKLDGHSLEIGTNVTDALEIGKYEPNTDGGDGGGTNRVKVKSGIPFPSHLIDKTDETRVQSCKKSFEELYGLPYYITVKCDGTSGTFLIDPETGEFLVCSRNLVRVDPNAPAAAAAAVVQVEVAEITEIAPGVTEKLESDRFDASLISSASDDDKYWYIANKYDLQNKLKSLSGRYAIQGEICGPNIQKNLLCLKDTELFVFNVIDIKYRSRVSYQDMVQICGELGLKPVPLVEQGASFPYTDVAAILKLSQGTYQNTKNQREGIVVRGDKISFKAINNEYLLKNDY
jgi:RNA ligase (TIGR02306 family)